MKLIKILSILTIGLVLLILASCSKGPVKPEGGIMVGGSISTDRASSAGITLKVSDDSSNIEEVGLTFTDLKCEGFSAGSYMSSASGFIPITNGEFQYKSSEFGELNGKFTSATSAEGTIHLAFYDGRAECGTSNWSAKVK